MNKEDRFNFSPLLGLKIAKYYLPFTTKCNVNIIQLGFLLRGKLGFLLKSRFCPYMKFNLKHCVSQGGKRLCKYASHCYYPLLFSPLGLENTAKEMSDSPTHSTPPRAFVLKIFCEKKGENLLKGEKGFVELTLLGENMINCRRPLLESLWYAADSLEYTGFEKMADYKNLSSSLIPSSWQGIIPVYVDQSWKIKTLNENDIQNKTSGQFLENFIYSLPDPVISKDEKGISKITVYLKSPYSSKKENSDSFKSLIMTIMNRLRNLKRFYLPEDRNMAKQPPDFYKQAGKIQKVTTLEKCFYQRFSSRQNKFIQMKGLSGVLVYKGNIEPFITLLNAASLIGAGNSTTFGFGSIDLQRKPRSTI